MNKEKEIPWKNILVVTGLVTGLVIVTGACEVVMALLGSSSVGNSGVDYFRALNGLLVLSLGAGFLTLAFWGRSWDIKRMERKKSAPDKPWLWKKAWRMGRIRDSSRRLTVFLTVFTAIVALTSSPACVISWKLLHQTSVDWIKLSALLAFPVVGIFLLLLLLFLLLRWAKIGTTYFEMATLPGVVGGKLAGVIRIRRQLGPEDGFRLRLSCIKTTGGGGGESKTRQVLHQEESTVARDQLLRNHSRTAIPVLFQIPSKAQPTGDRVCWQLAVEAKLPGLDYKTHFDVPVFKTSDSSTIFELDEASVARYVDQRSPDALLREQRILHESRIGNEVFRFPMFRLPGEGVALTVASAVCLGVCAVVFRGNGSDAWIVGAAFLLFGLLVSAWTVDHLFWCSRVEIGHGRVQLRHGLFGWRRHLFASSDVIRVIAVAGNQTNLRLYHDVRFVLGGEQGERQLTVGKRLRDQRVVDMLIGMYEDALRRKA